MNNKKRGNELNENQSAVNRRDLLKGVAVAGLGIAARAYGAPKKTGKPSKSPKSDLIQRENAKPGTRDWMLTNTRQLPGKINKILPNGRCPWIEGYCSANSVRAGETLQVMVSTNPVSEFSLEIFRTGYYGGTGGRSMQRFDAIQGKMQVDPEIGKTVCANAYGNRRWNLKFPPIG